MRNLKLIENADMMTEAQMRNMEHIFRQGFYQGIGTGYYQATIDHESGNGVRPPMDVTYCAYRAMEDLQLVQTGAGDIEVIYTGPIAPQALNPREETEWKLPEAGGAPQEPSRTDLLARDKKGGE